jgi:Ala-tRNA(Pro) deacylase
VRVVLDEAMLSENPLNFHPLRNDRTTAIAPSDLVKFIRATGHEPLVFGFA